MNIKSTLLVAAAACVYLAGCSQPDDKKTANTATQTTTATAPAAQGTNTAVALNPAHGAPGHRCDIEVGAPLNSPAMPNLQTPPPKPLAQPTVAGTNPPHGEPGHDCAKPVGAPL